MQTTSPAERPGPMTIIAGVLLTLFYSALLAFGVWLWTLGVALP